MVQPLGKVVWQLLQNFNVGLPYDPAIPLLGIHPKELKARIQRDICTPMFIAALCTMAKMWKQPKCLLMWSIHTMEYCSALERKEILIQAETWSLFFYVMYIFMFYVTYILLRFLKK